jgi:ATP-binding cassette subfamily F protein uup
VTILTASGLTKSFGPHTVLAGVDLTVSTGERVGLVGANGSGKSTLARILAGQDVPDTGELAVRREARVMYLAQEPVLDPKYNVLDTVLMGMTAWWSAKERFEEANAQLEAGVEGDALDRALNMQTQAHAELDQHGGFDMSHRALAIMDALGVREGSAAVDRLSGGEKRRVALARLLVAEPELAILDEPTNHLDIEAIEWLELHLADTFRGAVLLITHDRYFLDGIVDRTLEVERGKVFSYDGGFADYLLAKAERMALAERTEQNRQNFLRKELDWLSRGPPARTTKQQARIDRAESAVAARPEKKAKELDLQLATARSGKSVLDLDRVSIDSPPDAVGKTRRLVEDFTFHLTQGERVGVLGANGCGKSTFLKAILSEHPIASGRMALGKNSRIAYLSQHRTGLDEDKSILENVADGRSHLRIGDKEVHAISYLENFLFTSSDLRKPVKALSGGERTRVALAKLLTQETSLLLLDEPTNDLDLDTLAALEGLLLDYDITAIVVTHDRWFLDRIASSILWFEGQGKVTRFAGNFSTVRDYRDRQRAANTAAAKSNKPTPSQQPVAAAISAGAPVGKKPGLSYKEQKELEQLESKIARAEAKTSELETLLADPSLYQTRASEVPALVSKRDAAKVEAERLMSRWAELEEKRGS